MKGLVVFSFGLRDEKEEPNPCNIRLAKAVGQILHGYDDFIVVAQWEVARQLKKDGFHVDHVVHPTEGRYLDSDQVWEEAKEVFEAHGFIPEWSDIVPIAQPFLQMTKVKRMIKADGYNIREWDIGKIGFDNSPRNTQWYTKGPLRLLLYAVLQQLTGFRGHPPIQQKTRP